MMRRRRRTNTNRRCRRRVQLDSGDVMRVWEVFLDTVSPLIFPLTFAASTGFTLTIATTKHSKKVDIGECVALSLRIHHVSSSYSLSHSIFHTAVVCRPANVTMRMLT